jgi:hypothetical protein
MSAAGASRYYHTSQSDDSRALRQFHAPTPNPLARPFQTNIHRCILRLRKQLRCMVCPGRSSAELERKM